VRIKDKLPTYGCLYPDIPIEKQTAKSQEIVEPSRQFSHLFNAYAQAFNRAFNRKSSLFEENFERKWVDAEAYFTHLVQYIHKNPQKHGFVADFRDYPYSSYHSHISTKKTLLQRQAVHSWFGGMKNFEDFHVNNLLLEEMIESYIIELD
jgi:hypothetical protein